MRSRLGLGQSVQQGSVSSLSLDRHLPLQLPDQPSPGVFPETAVLRNPSLGKWQQRRFWADRTCRTLGNDFEDRGFGQVRCSALPRPSDPGARCGPPPGRPGQGPTEEAQGSRRMPLPGGSGISGPARTSPGLGLQILAQVRKIFQIRQEPSLAGELFCVSDACHPP